MARTFIGLGDAKAVKRYSVAMVHETSQKSFTGRNLTAKDGSLPIHRIVDLERQAGDTVSLDIWHRLTGRGNEGEVDLVGTEERLSSDTMTLSIDQLEHGVNCGGRMSQKRIMAPLREIGMKKLTEWWARMDDELSFVHMAGVRGAETGDWLLPTSYTGRASNTLVANTAGRTIIHRDASGTEGSIDDDAKMDVETLEEVSYQLKSMVHPPKPIMVNGEEKFIVIMSPLGEKQLRLGTSAGGWAEIRKYRTDEAPYWKDALGGWGNLILYSHSKIPKTNSGNSCAVAHNLILGAQALAKAHGDSNGNGQIFDWHEEMDNRGTVPIINTFSIFGHKRVDLKLAENDSAASEFGVITLLTYGGTTVS